MGKRSGETFAFDALYQGTVEKDGVTYHAVDAQALNQLFNSGKPNH